MAAFLTCCSYILQKLGVPTVVLFEALLPVLVVEAPEPMVRVTSSVEFPDLGPTRAGK
jgi:hypothetical protein